MLMSDIPRRNAKLYPEQMAIIENDVRINFDQLNKRINRLANVFLGLGLKRDDKVAVLYHNGYQYIELYFASAKAGIPIVPLNYRFLGKELSYIMNDSEAKAIFFGEKYFQVIEQIRKENVDVDHFICIDKYLKNVKNYEELIKMASDSDPNIPVGEDDVFIVGYTGGTTGLPKGVMTTHRNIITSCYNFCVDEIHLHPGSIFLNIPPLFHAGDAFAMFAFSFVGGTNVIMNSSAPEEILTNIQDHKVTHLLLVPSLMLFILQYAAIKKFDLTSLQCVIYGTAPMPVEPLQKIMEKFGCDFLQVYGATETFVPMSVLLPSDHVVEGSEEVIRRMSSAGREVIGVELRIVDDDDNEVKEGGIGEIIARGNNVMKGYWKLPELSKKTLKNGWYHTGDMGRMDDRKYLYIVDRKKDMIISGGENIYSKEIEDVFFRHPAIADVAVIGVPDDIWGEAVKAFVIKKEGMEVTEAELIEHCKRYLASYKKPKSIEFVMELPRSTAGKVLKRTLREKYWEGREKKI